MDIQKPPVWRRVLVADDITFHTFHQVIQAAFGWEDCHLYHFSAKAWGSKPVYQLPEDYYAGNSDFKDSRMVAVSEVFKTEGQELIYLYDFGDDWAHTIILEKISAKPLLRPLCIDGNGTCPPEDCGGPPGYAQFVTVLTNPKHPEHKEAKEWLGMEENDVWDVNTFDIDEANDMLSLIGL